MTDDPADRRPQLFISYASADVKRAQALHDRLVACGHRVWFDRLRLEPGRHWHAEIEAGRDASRLVLPIITPRWARSEWTRYETYGAPAVLPVIAEGEPEAVVPAPLRGVQGVKLDPLAADAADWPTLLRAIDRLLDEPPPAALSPVLDLPHPPNPFFIGREGDLARLHEALHEAPVAALTQGRVAAVAALGGVGKTTLANEYARRFWRLYPQILWVDARLGLEAGFAGLYAKLFPGRPTEGLKIEEVAQAALAELSSPAPRLLVIDNVEDERSVRPWLPKDARTGCRALITSRFADWPAEAGIKTVALYVLDPDPARQFLIDRTGRTAEGAELTACDALAEQLGYLPLALEQAAAFIKASAKGFSAYLELYSEAAEAMLDRRVEGSTAYPASVAATWRVTIDRLSPESRAILRLCAWFADTPIPRPLIEGEGGLETIEALAKTFPAKGSILRRLAWRLRGASRMAEPGHRSPALRLHDALAGLKTYSMIQDLTEETFRVHNLVQVVERTQAARDGADGASREAAAARLAAVFPGAAHTDLTHWGLCETLVAHVGRLRDLTPVAGRTLGLATACGLTGLYLSGRGRLGEARSFAATALDIRERVLGPDHPDTLTSLNNLALRMRALGYAAEAKPLHQRELAACERVLGPEHPDTLTSVNNLAECLYAIGDAAGALPLYRRALAARERVLGPEHPYTLSSVNNLAGCLYALGDAAGALPLHQRALAACERVLGPDHPQTLTSVNNLALCMRALGDAAGALPLHQRELAACERVLGPEHPDTLTSVNNLAGCLYALGDAAGALPLHQRALAALELTLGPEHPQTLSSVNNLAACMKVLGDAAGALPLCQTALAVCERVLGADHPTTVIIRGNLTSCEAAVGDRAASHPQPPASSTPQPAPAPARNAPCPCGSGLRYKHCHGALGER